MAYQSIWYYTDLPKKVIDIIEEDLIEYNSEMQTSLTAYTTEERTLKNGVRKSKNAWINSNHWISGFLMHYVLKANRENFLYNIDDLDGARFQYTQYDVGDYYHWHTDSSYANLKKPSRYTDFSEINEQKDFLVENTETMRKLSFVLQLTEPTEYKGGNLQILDETNKMYIAPRRRGTMILFDSRSNHRVTKIKEGKRKSIVGWVCGPRWK